MFKKLIKAINELTEAQNRANEIALLKIESETITGHLLKESNDLFREGLKEENNNGK